MALAGIGVPAVASRKSDDPVPNKTTPKRQNIVKPHQGAKEMERRRRQMARDRR